MDRLTPRRPPTRDVAGSGGISGGISGGARARVLLAAAFGPLVTGYAVVAALLACVSALAPHSHFSARGVLWAAVPGWLAAHQVPIEIEGAPLGILPLLPTAAACVLVAGTAAGAAQRLGYQVPAQAGSLVGGMAAAHALPGVLVSFLTRGTALGVNPLAAVCVPALLAGGSAVLGVARRCGGPEAIRHRLDPLALHGLRAGALGLAGLLTAAALTLGIALLLRVETVQALFAADAPGFGAGAGMLLLSLGYLPNAVGMALGFTTGPGFSIGEVSISPFTFTGGAVPGMPLLAALPQEHAFWWPVFLFLPLVAGVLVGWSVRRIHDDPWTRLRIVGIAGALVGFGTVVASTLAGGALGSGSFDPVAVSPGFASIAGFAWIVVPGGLVAWFAGPTRNDAVSSPDDAVPTPDDVVSSPDDVVSSPDDAVPSRDDAEPSRDDTEPEPQELPESPDSKEPPEDDGD